jgi:radical SAM protein with 4Fe4S-binding SPASM domain
VSLFPALPREVQVEVTGACNLRCRMCLVRYRPALDRRTGSLSLEAFKALIDELPRESTVTLQGLGEPLLAPHLFEMIAHASARDCRVGFNSNATLLTRDCAARLVQAGLAWLHISVDGATAETYEAIRDGARFESVAHNVRGLVEVRRDLGAAHPDLSLVFVAMRRNLHELPGVVRLAADWGVGRLRVQNLSHSFSDTDPAGSYREIRDFAADEALWDSSGDVDAVFADARAVAAARGVDLRLPRSEPTPATTRGADARGCDWPWRSAYVTRSGLVQPCCMLMGGDRAVLGDLSQASFAEIWHGAAYREFRAALQTPSPPEVCRGCALYRGVF